MSEEKERKPVCPSGHCDKCTLQFGSADCLNSVPMEGDWSLLPTIHAVDRLCDQDVGCGDCRASPLCEAFRRGYSLQGRDRPETCDDIRQFYDETVAWNRSVDAVEKAEAALADFDLLDKGNIFLRGLKKGSDLSAGTWNPETKEWETEAPSVPGNSLRDSRGGLHTGSPEGLNSIWDPDAKKWVSGGSAAQKVRDGKAPKKGLTAGYYDSEKKCWVS